MTLEVQVTRDSWLESIKMRSGSERSMKAYKTGIKTWDDFLLSVGKNELNVLRELRTKNQDPNTYLFLNQYILFLSRRGLPRKTIDVYFPAVRSWCAANGVMLFNEYVNRYVKLPKLKKELRVSLTMEQIRKLYTMSNSKRMKAILLVLLSSGMRISEVLQLRVGDVNFDVSPIQIKVRAATTKTSEERMAYMSKEAGDLVVLLLEGKQKTDYIFVEKFDHRTLISVEVLFNRLRKLCGFTEKYDGGRNYHVNLHAFRAYFMTQATKILGGDTAHALIGHHQYLDVYFRLDEKEKADKYHQLEGYVTMSEEYRQKITIHEKDVQLQKMKEMEKKIQQLEAYNKRQQSKNS